MNVMFREEFVLGNETGAKMRTIDRVNAVIRTERYRKAFEEYKKALQKYPYVVDSWSNAGISVVMRSSRQADEICKKFKIPFPFSPDLVLQPGLNFPPVVVNGKLGEDLWLPIKIDMTQKLKQVQAEIKRIHKSFYIRRRESKRNRPSRQNIWMIYDAVMEEVHKKVESKYAGKKFKSNPSLKTQNAKNALKKACRLIREVELYEYKKVKEVKPYKIVK